MTIVPQGGGRPVDPRIAFFDAQARDWDAHTPIGGENVLERLADLAELLLLSAGQDILEVGCGTGQITGWLAEQVHPGRVTAVDFSPAMITAASAKRIDADFHCKDACSDDFGLARHDVILCFHSFPHFRDQREALRRLSRALKPDGRLLILHLAGSARINEFHSTVDGPVRGDHLPQGGSWRSLMSQTNLRVNRLIDIDNLFFLEAVGVESDLF